MFHMSFTMDLWITKSCKTQNPQIFLHLSNLVQEVPKLVWLHFNNWMSPLVKKGNNRRHEWWWTHHGGRICNSYNLLARLVVIKPTLHWWGTKVLATFLMDSSTTFWPCYENGPKVVRTSSLKTSTYWSLHICDGVVFSHENLPICDDWP